MGDDEAVSVPNVLADRYASPEMAELWSAEHKIVLERRLWIAVMRAQRELGIDIPDEAIDAYESVVDDIDLDSIAARERVTRHDVKARIEEFSDLAGHEHAHKGMTSRDLTENVEQLQVRTGLELVRDRAVAALVRLAELAETHADTVIVGRSHNVAAQATTLGKRFATVADELLVAVQRAVVPLQPFLHFLLGVAGVALYRGSPKGLGRLIPALDLAQPRNLLRRGRYDQLADLAMGDPALAAIGVQQFLAAHAAARLQRIGGVVHPGVNHPGVAAGDALTGALIDLQHPDPAAAQSQRTGNRQPDHAGTHHDAVDIHRR